jgi:hypothetical protein
MYYRIAIQTAQSSNWQWQSTPLNSLGALLRWLQFYRIFPRDRLRIFSSCERQQLHAQLAALNQGRLSTSVTATQFLQERRIQPPERTREAPSREEAADRRWQPSMMEAIAFRNSYAQVETNVPGNEAAPGVGSSAVERSRETLESGEGGDHDVAYRFVLPASMPQVTAWVRLLAKVQQGELEP